MNASKFLIPTAAAVALASIIGIAYAQTGTMNSDTNVNRDNVANPTNSNNNTGTSGTANNRSTDSMNRDTTGALRRNSTSTTNLDSTGARSNERVARADRN
jgi:hypothetical protein